ncbi:heterokaryon incompatibility protein-domain-containing protein [Trametes gibbosa]|nr:heterokaryon incompatibility protein-domain-containing protein [Trametes gibbosa]
MWSALHTTPSTPPRPSTICQACWEGLFAAHLGLFNAIVRDQWLGGPSFIGGYSYSTSRSKLNSRAERCSWCRLVLTMCDEGQSLLRITVGRLVDDTGESSSSITSHSINGGLQTLMVLINNREVYRGYLHTPAEDPAAAHINSRSPILDVGSPRTLDLVKEHVDECLHKHERCMSIPDAALADPPVRLVNCAYPDHPRLVETKLHGYAKYIALSHVWGGTQPYGTCTDNLSYYEKGIDVCILPQTIRDAIYVTHSLGHQYLWVDSLCIVQDSYEEKCREIGRIDQFYRGAFLTIVAGSAHASSEGFLHDRPATSRGVTFPFICPSRPHDSSPRSARATGQSVVGTARITPTFIHTEGEIQQFDAAKDPVHRIGWLMQELLLSPRALIFTSETLQFRCHTSTQNIGKSFYDARRELRLPDVVFLPQPPRVVHYSDEWIAAHQSWVNIVEDYSGRAVSALSDRMIACSAMARDLQRALESEYLAGLWRHSLLSDLLWFTTTAAQSVTYREQPLYIVPSWSWASIEAVDGQVKMEPYLRPPERTTLSEVAWCKVTLKKSSLPYGEVICGSLGLRTPALIRCTIHSKLEPRGYHVQFHYAQKVPPRSGDVCNDLDDEVRTTTKCFGTAKIDCDDEDGPSMPETLWAVPLSRKGGILEGLLVALSWQADRYSVGPASERKVYRRVGLVHAPADKFRNLEVSPAWLCIEIV